MRSTDTKGLGFGFLAYGLWAVFPLYFHLLGVSTAVEVVAHRIWWSLLFCVAGVTIMGAWRKVRRVFVDRKLVGILLVAGVLLSTNWLIYIFAVLTDHIVDGALGYFINPLVTICLAVIFLKETVRRAQAVALGIAVLAVVVLIIGVGRVPWIGLGLAFSFGLYSLVKSKVGHQVTPTIGLGIEALGIAPLALGFIIYLEFTRQGTFTTISWTYALLVVGTGIVTAIPLLFFAAAAARLPLVLLAFIQYITPIGQFLIGVLVFHEEMPVERWVGFILIWLALAVLSWDMVRQVRTQRSQDPL